METNHNPLAPETQKNDNKQILEAILMEAEKVICYAYLYPASTSESGGFRQEYVFAPTPENIANFIGAHQFEASKIIITDIWDCLIISTIGSFLDTCAPGAVRDAVMTHLMPLQTGNAQPKDINILKREDFENAWKEVYG